MPLIKSLAAAGDLVYFHDYRSGHCANQVGYSAGTFDGVVAGTAGRFRTGVGYETSHNGLGSPTNLLVDGDMELPLVGAWTPFQSTLTKEGAPHSGAQCLRVTATNAVGFRIPGARQTILTVGKSYLITGWARSDATQVPIIEDGIAIFWTGTASVNWQYFSFVAVAANVEIYFMFFANDPTGVEYVEFDDITVTELSLSNGYIRVADNASFFPPAGGMCLVASYMQSDASDDCQIIGQGSDLATNTSWQLKRTATQIQFVTSDNANLATFSHNLAASPGQIETVTVRYTGGAVGNNCTISVLTPAISASTGLAGAVPQNVAQPVGIGSYSTSTAYPFFGTLRYCAFVRGAQTAAILAALAAELEAIDWPDAVSVCDVAGLTTDRAVQYMSRFGVSASIADEGNLLNSEISNSGWLSGTAAGGVSTWQVMPLHVQNVAAGGPADVVKKLICTDGRGGVVRLPIEKWSPSTTPTNASFGTWDFWAYHLIDTAMSTWLVHTLRDFGAGPTNAGYYVTMTATDLILQYYDAGGGVANLITVPNVLVGSQIIHVRVTRTTPAGLWKMYYQICNGGVTSAWIQAPGTATDITQVISDGMMLNYANGDALLIGNHRSEKALLKWYGVVNPL